MPAATRPAATDRAVRQDAHRVLSALHAGVADHRLAGRPAPGRDQVAVVLRALSTFPLCIRILPQSDRRRRSGDAAAGVSRYLAGFADHLAHHGERTTYDPEYWILGEPVTDRLLRLVSGTPADTRPTDRQVAAVLLALADTRERAVPRRSVEVAGDGDLPWNGATGIGTFFQDLADHVLAG